MKGNTFIFYGATKKAEIILGFITGICVLLVAALIQYLLFHKMLGIQHIKTGHFIMSIFMGTAIAMVLFKFVEKHIITGIWQIHILDNNTIELFY